MMVCFSWLGTQDALPKGWALPLPSFIKKTPHTLAFNQMKAGFHLKFLFLMTLACVKMTKNLTETFKFLL